MARQVHDRDIAAVLAAADQCIKTRVPRVALMAVAILIASGAVRAGGHYRLQRSSSYVGGVPSQSSGDATDCRPSGRKQN
jgi:hypothetical protein